LRSESIFFFCEMLCAATPSLFWIARQDTIAPPRHQIR
jgi:hypothetical protein